MARLLVGAAIGIAVGVVAGAALGIHADQYPTDETLAVAQEAHVDPLDLQGASNTTGLDPRDYLIAVGELAPSVAVRNNPTPPINNYWPIGGWLGQRIYCIEAIESHHGAAMYNPQAWFGEHAQGFLGWLPSTARRWGVVIGNRASEWSGAAKMLASGAGGQFFGVASGRC